MPVVNTAGPWSFPAFPLRLKDDDVHVWRARLEPLDPRVLEFASLLSDEERTRAARFRFERHRRRFVMGRAVLRTILAVYLGGEPRQLEFCYGTYGKPYLTQKCANLSVQFNLTHSNELVLCAFTRMRRVGVDLEYIRRTPEVEKLATELFPQRDNLTVASNTEKFGAFYNRWTRTEAYAKAVGTGLSEYSDSFDAPLMNEEPALPFHWFITSFVPAPDYTASLAVEGQDCVPHYFEFMPRNSLSEARTIVKKSPGFLADVARAC